MPLASAAFLLNIYYLVLALARGQVFIDSELWTMRSEQISARAFKIALMLSCLLSIAACLAVPCEIKVEGTAFRVDVSTLK